jgi:hypothetical protein
MCIRWKREIEGKKKKWVRCEIIKDLENRKKSGNWLLEILFFKEYEFCYFRYWYLIILFLWTSNIDWGMVNLSGSGIGF